VAEVVERSICDVTVFDPRSGRSLSGRELREERSVGGGLNERVVRYLIIEAVGAKDRDGKFSPANGGLWPRAPVKSGLPVRPAGADVFPGV